MDNIELLLQNNNRCDSSNRNQFMRKHYDSSSRNFYFENHGNDYHPYMKSLRVFCDSTIEEILKFLNSYFKFATVRMPIRFYMGEVFVADKLVYIIFECICYYLISRGIQVELYMSVKASDMWTEGINTVSLRAINKKFDKYTKDIFTQGFEQGILRPEHFRVIIPGDIDLESNYLGEIENDISDFFNNFISENGKNRFEHSEKEIDDICSVIGEMIGNSCEHANADVLVDIDVTSDYRLDGYDKLVEKYKLDRRCWYCGINVVVLNFSSKNIYDDIKDKMENGSVDVGKMPRYAKLREAFEFHSKQFSDKYSIEDFYALSAFQYKISGRKNKSSMGGTGLANLIQYIEERIGGMCYIMSGKSIIDFHKETLDQDEDFWVGFNTEKNFFSKTPDESVCLKSKVYFPGTAYNLTFLMKGDISDE